MDAQEKENNDGAATDTAKENVSQIYEKAHEHWTSIASDVHGMLGGFEQLHQPDITASKLFIASLKKMGLLINSERALDCGSGIGRVTKHLLLPDFSRVDMVDFAEQFVQNAKAYIGQPDSARVGQQFVEPLHSFTPTERYYDLIWIQWVSGYLCDEDLTQFLRRCMRGIRQSEGGCVVLKENITSNDTSDFDEVDHSWTRPRHTVLSLFEEAGCRVVAERKQLNFPKGIYEVRMFALRPIEGREEEESH